MSPAPWKAVEGHDFHALRVPALSQPEGEDECVIYALWMVIHYFLNEHPEKSVREETNGLSSDEIRENITVTKRGWVPKQDELTLLSESTRSIRFRYQFSQGEPPKDLSTIIEEHLHENVPFILIIDALQLRQGIRSEGPLHAVVVTGLGDSSVAINDPWGYLEDTVDKEKLKDAWDPQYNSYIGVSVSNRISSKQGEGQ